MTTIRNFQTALLKKRFLDRGKAQPEVFERLSIIVEEMTTTVKERLGERSGALARAFEKRITMKQRFTARKGIPPKNIYRTPDAWIQVIEKLAGELSENPDAIISSALEAALAPGAAEIGAAGGWLDELYVVLGTMAGKLKRETDMVALADYISRAGLLLDGDEITVAQWPGEAGGLRGGLAYRPSVLGLTPHVLGINYMPLSDQNLEISVNSEALLQNTAESEPVPAELVSKAHVTQVVEGTRIGMAFTADAETGAPELALFEWQLAEVRLRDSEDRMLQTFPTPADLDEIRELVADQSGPPPNWLPNSVRFHFPGSAGFARLAASLVVHPWIWTDSEEHDFWCPDPLDVEGAPVAAPRHTVAAAIEGNLLYAASAGQIDERLDHRLIVEIQRVASAVKAFRSRHETKRRANRDVLFSEWKAD